MTSPDIARRQGTAVVVTPSPFAALDEAATRALGAAAGRYGKFLGAPVVLA